MARQASLQRETTETKIDVDLDLDGSGVHRIDTPLPFLTHMVEQLARHGLLDLRVHAEGDTEIDGHHLTEDLGFCLGGALSKALGSKAGIRRYGSATLPMDEALAMVALDLSGRPYFAWQVPMAKAKVGSFDTELAEVFFEAFARGAEMNLHVRLLAGENLHHIIEVCFKALARALREAIALDPRDTSVPSTKGSLRS